MVRKDFYLYLILFFIFIVTYVFLLGSYQLIDVDETRYVEIAKKMFYSNDYLSLKLNGEYFFEKPPLFFWLECLSFKLFGNISEFTARIPIVLLSLLPLSLLFSISKKVKDINFAFINSIILMSSLEYIILTKMAILDSVFTSFTVASILCYFYTFYLEGKKQKIFNILIYIFSAFAVLAKGIPGIIIPYSIIIVNSIIFKNYKNLFFNLLFGTLIFLIIVVPWHYIMLDIHGMDFFNDYIVKHHIMRFIGSDIIGKQQPVYFYILTILWGFFPYIFTFIFGLIIDIKEFFKKKINFLDINKDFGKFIFLNVISMALILIFFSVSTTKLITYILPIFPFIAILSGRYFYEFIYETKNKNFVYYSLITLVLFMFIVALLSCFISFYIEKNIYINIKNLQIFIVLIFFIFSFSIFYLLISNKRLYSFICIAVFMSLISSVGGYLIHKFDYSFGQDDLMKYAKYAKENNYTISTYLTGKRYSILYYSDLDKIDFHVYDENWFKEEIKKKNNIIVIRNRDLKSVNIWPKYKGVKYSILQNN